MERGVQQLLDEFRNQILILPPGDQSQHGG